MKVFRANLEDVFREAAARWTLLAYFVLTTLFILLFATAVNLDIVNGSLAGARLFGESVQVGRHQPLIGDVVAGIDTGIAGTLFLFGTLLALFATAHLVPRMLEKGTVDLYFSRPVGRVRLLLQRYVAGLILVATNLVYLFGAYQLIITAKTGVFRPQLWLAALTLFFVSAVLLAFVFLVGTITASSTVSLMAGFTVFLAGTILRFHEKMAAAMDSRWAASLVDGLYWLLPKTGELWQTSVLLVLPEKLAAQKEFAVQPQFFLTTAAFGLASLALAAFTLHRRDF